MRVLLDTHSWLWMDLEPERLSPAARLLLEDGNNQLLLSAACVWEVSLKYATKKLRLPIPPREYVPERIRRHGMTPLDITPEHAMHSGELPRHHLDPFDRLLIAQARIERVPIVTSDPKFKRYDVDVIDA